MTSYSPGPKYPIPGVVITPFSKEMNPHFINTPASGTWGAAAQALFFPIYLHEPFEVKKAFWVNGGTVGTDSLDIGVYEMTDPTTGRLDLIRSVGATLSASASTLIETATWRTARANLTASSDSTDSQTYTTASVTLKTGRLYLMAVENSHGSSASAVSSIDNAGTWVSRSTVQYNSSLNRVSIWSFVPTTDYTGTLVINFGATTQTGCVWSLTELSGVDTATNDGIVQQATGTGNSTTALSTLAAFGSASNSTFGAHGHAAATASAPGTGFTELSDTTAATPAQALCTDWRVDNDTTVDATFTSAQWGSCAVEIKADTTTPFVIPVANTYMGFVISGTTATVHRAQPSATAPARSGGVLSLTTSFPLRSSCTPQTTDWTNFRAPLAGFSRRSLLG